MSLEDKPLWLLDFDEVVNVPALPGRNPPGHIWPGADWIDTRGEAEGRRYRILAARPVLDFITRIHEGDYATILWHTSWQQEIYPVAEELGLPRFGYVDAPEYSGGGDKDGPWWKLPGAWRTFGQEGRVVWTDDDLNGCLTPSQESRLRARPITLLIAPSIGTGLTRKHLTAIACFLGAQYQASWSTP